jgi:hypothetical protein
MIEEKDLLVGALCRFLNAEISVYAWFIINDKKEGSDIVTYEVSGNSDWFVFDFVNRKDIIIDSLNEELRVWRSGITVTDYELDEKAGYIYFKIA